MKKFAVATAVVAALAAMSAQATTLEAPDGVRYRLEEGTTANPLVHEFVLTITRQNSAFDTVGGRTGINAIAFNKPDNFASATMLSPATGFNFTLGGLNSGGCNGSGNFFCFDNMAIPPIPVALLPTTPIVFDFTVTLSSGNFSGYLSPDFKIDWVGPETNNYDNVSLGIGVEKACPDCTINPTVVIEAVPEPASLALMALALGGIGVGMRKRKQ